MEIREVESIGGIGGIGGVGGGEGVEDIGGVVVIGGIGGIGGVVGGVGATGGEGVASWVWGGEEMIIQDPASDAIDKAVATIVLREPWYASLLLRLLRRSTTTVPTIGTNGQVLAYNPGWIKTVSDSELLGVLLHETLHCALLHITRCGSRDPLKWNIACDRVVNAIVLKAGYKLPTGCVPPTALSRTAEEEYLDLPEDSRCGGSPGKDLLNPVLDPISGSPEIPYPGFSSTALEHEWKEAVAAGQGCAPQALRRHIQDILAVKYPWKELLSSWLSLRRLSDNRTWTRRNRRIQGLPGRKPAPNGEIAVVLDTSGSISPQQLNEFHSELKGILQSIPESRVHCLSSDAGIHDIIEPGEPLPRIWQGGGGTDFRPALSWAELHGMDAVVYLTDGCGTFPLACIVPVCWVIPAYSHQEVPFGLVVSLE